MSSHPQKHLPTENPKETWMRLHPEQHNHHRMDSKRYKSSYLFSLFPQWFSRGNETEIIDRSLNGRELDSTQSQVFGSERSVSYHCLPKYRERDTRKRRKFVTDCILRKGLLQCCIIGTYISGDDHSALGHINNTGESPKDFVFCEILLMHYSLWYWNFWSKMKGDA